MPLLSFEGIDGSGKSTQIELLCNWFAKNDTPYLVFREPGGTSLSESIRSLLLDTNQQINPVAELLLFSAARAQLITEKIEPALKEGKWIILDRFFDSTTAYQGYGRAVLPLEQIHQLNALATNNLVPDLTIYLDIDYSVSIDRRKNAENDRMESGGKAFYEKIIQGYRTIANSEPRVRHLDASKETDIIHKDITQLIIEKFSVKWV